MPITSRADTGDAERMTDRIGWFVIMNVPSGIVRIPPPIAPEGLRLIETTSYSSGFEDWAYVIGCIMMIADTEITRRIIAPEQRNNHIRPLDYAMRTAR